MAIFAIDFDGTLCEHKYPDIGKEITYAFDVLKELIEHGHKLILYTMRCDSEKEGPVLTQAVEWCKEKGIEFWGVNVNPTQHHWSNSPKVYCNLYIDDAALGCPLQDSFTTERKCVDWIKVYEMLQELGYVKS